jgi:hypothetical protein
VTTEPHGKTATETLRAPRPRRGARRYGLDEGCSATSGPARPPCPCDSFFVALAQASDALGGRGGAARTRPSAVAGGHVDYGGHRHPHRRGDLPRGEVPGRRGPLRGAEMRGGPRRPRSWYRGRPPRSWPRRISGGWGCATSAPQPRGPPGPASRAGAAPVPRGEADAVRPGHAGAPRRRPCVRAGVAVGVRGAADRRREPLRLQASTRG